MALKETETPDTWEFHAHYARVKSHQAKVLKVQNRHRAWMFTLIGWAANSRRKALSAIRQQRTQRAVKEQLELFVEGIKE